jgi:tetratricopeptide (TPR) repeat protein
MAADRAALSIMEMLGDHGGVASCFNQMGIVSAEAEDLAQSGTQFERAHQAAVRAGDLRTQGQSLTNHGTVLARNPEMVGESRVKLHEALTLWEALGDEWSAAVVHNNLGDIEFASGDSDRALGHYRRSIELLRALGTRSDTIAYNIQGCAGVAASRGEFVRAIRLAGGADSQHHETGLRFNAYQVGLVDRWLSPAYAALGSDEAAAAWREGQQMGFEALLTYALSDA